MNLDQLIEECRFRTGFNDSSYNLQWTSFINDGVDQYAAKWPWPGHEEIIQLTSDGTRFLVFPEYVDQVVSLLNRSQGIPVDPRFNLDRESPYVHSQRTQGTVIGYEKAGVVPVLREPSGYLFFQSSPNSEAATVYVTGYCNASGASGTGLERVFQVESITCLGNTATTLTTQFASIVSISRSTDSSNAYYFYDAGDSNAHISCIPQYETSAAFKRVLLQYAPSAQTLFEARIRHKVRPLKLGSQSPHPSVDPRFVISYAVSRYWKAQQQYSKAQIDRGEAIERVNDRANVEENFNEGYSQITPYVPYPPDYPELRH